MKIPTEVNYLKISYEITKWIIYLQQSSQSETIQEFFIIKFLFIISIWFGQLKAIT